MKVFITGVSSGIGRTLAVELIKTGHEVWGIARRQEALEELKKNLNSGHLSLSRCDIENLNDLKNVVGEMRAKNFIPDVLVLNAAVNLQDPSNNFNFELYRKSFDINLYGTLFWVAEFLDEFLKRNHGQFIAISSISAFRHGHGGISYSVSKIPILVSSADRAARHIIKIFNRSGGEYYFPFFMTWFFRLFAFLPESLFIFLSKHLNNKN